MKTLQFIEMNPNDFKNEIINGILEIMEKPKEDEVLMTQKEVADFYKVSVQTIIKWQKDGKIKCYSIGSERRYKKSELLENLVLMK